MSTKSNHEEIDARSVPTRRQVNWIKWTLIFAVVAQLIAVIYMEGQRSQQMSSMASETQSLALAIQADHAENIQAINALSNRVDNVYALVAGKGR